jgi:hypothetical protein
MIGCDSSVTDYNDLIEVFYNPLLKNETPYESNFSGIQFDMLS